MVKEYNHDKIKMIKNFLYKNGRRFMKLLIFYPLYYDNSYNFVFVFQIRFFCKQGMQWNTYYIKYVIEKQDGSKVEGKNLEKKTQFSLV